MKKVSIIIPVYNAEKFLNKSVDSCLAQTMIDNLEIIIVDDCSTDNSRILINDYVQKYPNIIRSIFLSQNSMQGAARNLGIQIATGEYLAFVDADDWIEPDMCEVLYQEAKSHDADMAGGDSYNSYNDKEILNRHNYSTTSLGVHNRTAVGYYSYYCGLFWTRIYRRSMIIKNEIYFLEGISYEDSYFNYLTALYANKVIKIEKAFYHYFYNPDSITRKRNDEKQYAKLDVIMKTYEECKKRGLYKQFAEEIDFKFIYMMASSIVPFVSNFDKPDVTHFIKISNLIKCNTPRYRNNRYYHLIGWKLKVMLDLTVLLPKMIPLLHKIIC